MLLTSVLAILAVLLGGVLGVSRNASQQLLGVIRAAGLGSGCFAVFGQLLPEATEDLGVLALLPFALALLASTGAERVLMTSKHWAHHHGRPDANGEVASAIQDGVTRAAAGVRTSLEIGLVALAAHQIVEGVALGALANPAAHHSAASRIGMIVALAAHTIPIVAMLALAFRAAVGLYSTIARVVALAMVSGVGVLVAGLPRASDLLAAQSGWIHAVVAGLLLHAVLHAASPQIGHEEHAPPSTSPRILQALGFAAGAALVVMGIVASDAMTGFLSLSTWIVVVLAGVLAVLMNRAWPHAARLGALSLGS